MVAPNLNALPLGSRTITAAVSDQVLTEGVSAANVAQAYWDRLGGINGLTLIAAFTYGSGGTSVAVTVDTALGSGIWIPVAKFAFTTASATKQLVLSRTAVLSAATLSTPGDDAAINLIGDRLRARITSVGTYGSNTVIDVRAQPHA